MTRAAGLLVAVLGCVVLIGWAVDNERLTRLCLDCATMKPLTALGFILAGLGVSSIKSRHRCARDVQAATGGILLMSTSWAVLGQLGFATAMIVQDDGHLSPVPGVPSLGAMAGFLLISVALFGRALHDDYFRGRLTRACGWVLLAIGGVALAGYALSAPLLYYYRAGNSTALAVHSAIGFCLLGAGMAWGRR